MRKAWERDARLPLAETDLVSRGLGVFLRKALLQITSPGVIVAMPSKMSRKRKQTLVRLAEEMRNKKKSEA